MRKALDTLPWVEHKTIETNVKDRYVTFSVTDKAQFDEEKLLAALKTRGYPKAKVLAGPSSE